MRFSFYLVSEIKFVRWPPFVRKSRNKTLGVSDALNYVEQDNRPVLF